MTRNTRISMLPMYSGTMTKLMVKLETCSMFLASKSMIDLSCTGCQA